MTEALKLNGFDELNYNELYAIDGGGLFLAAVCGAITVAAIVVTIACPPAAPATTSVAAKCIGIAVTGTIATGGAYFI
jgi:hypothetical protein